jgi:hypothetical protein
MNYGTWNVQGIGGKMEEKNVKKKYREKIEIANKESKFTISCRH